MGYVEHSTIEATPFRPLLAQAPGRGPRQRGMPGRDRTSHPGQGRARAGDDLLEILLVALLRGLLAICLLPLVVAIAATTGVSILTCRGISAFEAIVSHGIGRPGREG